VPQAVDEGRSESDVVRAKMLEHDEQVGQLLKKLKDLGVDDNTMEKAGPQSKEWGYIGRKFFAQKMWAPTAAGPFLAALLKSLQEFPPRQGADSLSMKKAIEEAMRRMDRPWTAPREAATDGISCIPLSRVAG
jgi:arylsulfatase